MTANTTTPGKPRKPEIDAVTKLIGTCNPIKVPNEFKKKRNKAPISILITPCPIKRIGVIGAPIINRRKIIPANTDIITNGSKSPPPSHLYY
jgi:hypothetical protein